MYRSSHANQPGGFFFSRTSRRKVPVSPGLVTRESCMGCLYPKPPKERETKEKTQPEMPKRMFRCYIYHHISYVSLCPCTKIPYVYSWSESGYWEMRFPEKNTTKNQQNHRSVRSKFSSSNRGTWNLTLYGCFDWIFLKSRFHDLG